MLSASLRKKLESVRDLPAMPTALSNALEAIEDPNTSAKALASIIEQDQALSARTLRVANSPYYGFTRKVSTVDLAIVVMGFNAIREVVLSSIMKKFIAKIDSRVFDIESYWNYSIYCSSVSKYFAEKFDYSPSGEAFVAGLMHDIGYLVIVSGLKNEYRKIKSYLNTKKYNLIEAETAVLGASHAEVGAWLAEKWSLPEKLIAPIRNHHNEISLEETPFEALKPDEKLTLIVSAAESFAETLNLKNWASEKKKSPLFFREDYLEYISDDYLLDKDSAIEKIKAETVEEFKKSLEIHS